MSFPKQEKLSSDEVPQKFAEWLLSMGCPAEKVPSVDKLTEICRGLYYMVWRSLMEFVEPKDSIKIKRLQIFIDDIQRCQKRNAFCKPDSSVVEPEELLLWKQQKELRERLEGAETRLRLAKQDCNKLVDKVSSRMSHRNVVRVQVENAQRRAWLHQQVADELRNKKANLLETKSIAESLCRVDDSVDIESKLDKCMSRRQYSRAPGASVSANPLQSSLTSNNGDLNDSEEYISLVRCGGHVLWPRLAARRAALVPALERACATRPSLSNTRGSPQSVLSHTASLQCTLALGALKHRAHVAHSRARLAHALTQLQSGSSCELVVLLSELANADARVATFRELLDDVTHGHAAFATADGLATTALHTNSTKQISVIDKAIESKRDELKKVITSLAVTERKIQNVRECLINVFNSFHSEGPEEYGNSDRFGGQLSIPQESIASLRRFYEEKREKQRNKMDLSMNFDTSADYSYNEDNPNPKFIDELKVYLKKFNLEQNRKLILESGEKIWIFETLQSSIDRLHTRLQDLELSCSLVCPSVSLRGNLQQLLQLVQRIEELSAILRVLESRQKKDIVIDVPAQTEEELRTIDNIKKRLNENLLSLQKTVKMLDLGQENLKLWSENQIRKYISSSRKIDGRTYKEYESCYVENLNLNM